jgi:hypothetical protein
MLEGRWPRVVELITHDFIEPMLGIDPMINYLGLLRCVEDFQHSTAKTVIWVTTRNHFPPLSFLEACEVLKRNEINIKFSSIKFLRYDQSIGENQLDNTLKTILKTENVPSLLVIDDLDQLIREGTYLKKFKFRINQFYLTIAQAIRFKEVLHIIYLVRAKSTGSVNMYGERVVQSPWLYHFQRIMYFHRITNQQLWLVRPPPSAKRKSEYKFGFKSVVVFGAIPYLETWQEKLDPSDHPVDKPYPKVLDVNFGLQKHPDFPIHPPIKKGAKNVEEFVIQSTTSLCKRSWRGERWDYIWEMEKDGDRKSLIKFHKHITDIIKSDKTKKQQNILKEPQIPSRVIIPKASWKKPVNLIKYAISRNYIEIDANTRSTLLQEINSIKSNPNQEKVLEVCSEFKSALRVTENFHQIESYRKKNMWLLPFIAIIIYLFRKKYSKHWLSTNQIIELAFQNKKLMSWMNLRTIFNASSAAALARKIAGSIKNEHPLLGVDENDVDKFLDDSEHASITLFQSTIRFYSMFWRININGIGEILCGSSSKIDSQMLKDPLNFDGSRLTEISKANFSSSKGHNILFDQEFKLINIDIPDENWIGEKDETDFGHFLFSSLKLINYHTDPKKNANYVIELTYDGKRSFELTVCLD